MKGLTSIIKNFNFQSLKTLSDAFLIVFLKLIIRIAFSMIISVLKMNSILKKIKMVKIDNSLDFYFHKYLY